MKDFKPRIVIFRCDYCSPPGVGERMAVQMKDNFRPTVISTTCTGRIDPTYVLDAFAKGADGVMVMGDTLGDCHFVTGNYKAMRNVLLLQKLLGQMGIEPDRLKAEWTTADAPKFLTSLNSFVDRVTRMGPLKAA